MRNILLACVLCAASTAGCGDDNINMAINFQANVGTQSFECGLQYDDLGTDGASLSVTDFRFYVHNIELGSSDGTYQSVALNDTAFQSGTVALLDFEDCGEAGNAEMNASVTGSVPDRDYDRVRFTLGIPFDRNHENPAVAASPLNLIPLQWNWQGGYKFVRIDSGSFSDTDWRFHLGSTGCDGDPSAGGTTECSTPNRLQVELTNFDPNNDVIVADLAALLAGSAVAANQEGTPFGCMSGPMDMDCAPIFERLGLSFAGSTAGSQSFFRVE